MSTSSPLVAFAMLRHQRQAKLSSTVPQAPELLNGGDPGPHHTVPRGRATYGLGWATTHSWKKGKIPTAGFLFPVYSIPKLNSRIPRASSSPTTSYQLLRIAAYQNPRRYGKAQAYSRQTFHRGIVFFFLKLKPWMQSGLTCPLMKEGNSYFIYCF